MFKLTGGPLSSLALDAAEFAQRADLVLPLELIGRPEKTLADNPPPLQSKTGYVIGGHSLVRYLGYVTAQPDTKWPAQAKFGTNARISNTASGYKYRETKPPWCVECGLFPHPQIHTFAAPSPSVGERELRHVRAS